MRRKQFISALAAFGVLAMIHAANSATDGRMNGSISVQGKISDEDRASQAQIGIDAVIQSAAQIQPGKIIKAELEEENGFLVWEVEVITPENTKVELLLDAGNGALLRRKPDR